MAEQRSDYGGLFEDFRPGQIFKHWPGKTITESDNNLFSLLTRNDNPLHSDAHHMASHQHGRILVNGTLVFSLVVGMSVRDTSGQAVANLEYERVTHDGPVFIGDTIYGETEVLETRESRSRPTQGIVTVRTTGKKSDGTVFMTYERTVLVPKRGHAVDDRADY